MKQNVNEMKCIHYNDIFDEYGIVIPSDSESVLILRYCPWCGQILPTSKRDEWFETLEELGFEDPLMDDNIPGEFKTSRWRKK